ncbi:protein of unknown function (DUF1952) [Desulfosporosinus orientis DSM 765]|uniref:Molybdopterin cofactor biosynthesis MoaD-related C-terminal domain-containing protein n=1 Tax=Desulfosporosinus orientis (strain ATCC 19365 / DSM 765 / NCIMB 8382 / VKM B-1628 / Singapore I) TaxID=768706 RepID=G7W7J9_DESOD|nr:hypothetical protein [Desulfosporosinus orientis]AET65918.1 protein of unknown function (DUF1952) [Desulfosporosinus orientis DSM 765]
MGIKEYSLEMRGMPHRALEEYFLSIGGKRDGDGMYFGPNWQVDLSDTWACPLGSIQIPATRVTFRVEEKDWPEIVRAFRLRFLSAGG